MDILHLVDRLEELFNESRPIWFTHSVAMDEDRLLDLIDQMRVSIPEEIKKAQQILAQRDRILAQAQEEATRTLSLARDKSESLLERDPIVQAAQARADQIIAQARLEIEGTKHEADDYVLDTLTKLEMEMERLLNQARNGVRALQSEQQSREQIQQQNPASIAAQQNK
jgi:vacuolar-type H+-ATPase subunit H